MRTAFKLGKGKGKSDKGKGKSTQPMYDPPVRPSTLPDPTATVVHLSGVYDRGTTSCTAYNPALPQPDPQQTVSAPIYDPVIPRWGPTAQQFMHPN